MRRAVLGLVVTASLGALGLLVQAGLDDRELAFTTGVAPTRPVARLSPGMEACQAPLRVVEEFSAVRFEVGTAGLPGTALEVTVKPQSGARTLARGRLRGGYRDRARPSVTVGRVAAGERVRVCIGNAGRRPIVALAGGPGYSARRSTLAVDGRTQPADLWLEFQRGEPRSALSLVPQIFRRAALFHPSWAGPWLFWLLAFGMLAGLPALLAAALASVRSEETEAELVGRR